MPDCSSVYAAEPEEPSKDYNPSAVQKALRTSLMKLRTNEAFKGSQGSRIIMIPSGVRLRLLFARHYEVLESTRSASTRNTPLVE